MLAEVDGTSFPAKRKRQKKSSCVRRMVPSARCTGGTRNDRLLSYDQGLVRIPSTAIMSFELVIEKRQ